MQHEPSHLLLAVLAFHRKYISREQLLEATAAWMTTPELDLGRLLVEGKYILPEQHEALLGLVGDWGRARARTAGPAPEMSKELRETMVALRRARQAQEAAPAARDGSKYEPGAELGRGGLGRVIEATDRELGRKVALKLLIEDAPEDLLERFRWEAKITGRLEHPNIVPVHEVGRLPDTREHFLCMKKIVGRDFADVIHEHKVPLRRQVEAFRDACRAIAYAHSMGVIHRDIKPANIMLGDFGEVLVVDWGLARLTGEADRPSQFRRGTTSAPRKRPTPIARKEETKGLTLEGDILGTPSYMPPEQALGKLAELDERSDVYSLGATLYEILAWRPPFDGDTAQDILDQVVGKPLTKPSMARPCPPELEKAVLRAMAWEQARRYPNVRALIADLDAWLEGTEERERRQRMADERVARAREEAARWRRLREEAAGAARQAEGLRRALPHRAGAAERRPSWELEDRAAALQRDGEEAFSEANESLSSALSLLPEHAEARRLKAELFWEKFLEVEERGGGALALPYRHVAEAYNDGSLDADLRGDGSVAVRARAYPCACLRDGRPVAAADLWVRGCHPWSGRRRDGIETAFAPEFEKGVPARLRVHAASCRPEPLAQAEAWAFRCEERDRVLVPATPDGTAAGPAVPREVLDALWGASPFRPLGPGVYLGRTPVARRPLPMGSWVLVLAAAGRAPARRPFTVGRRQDVELDVTLFAPAEIPPGLLPVPAARFLSVTDSGNPLDPDEITRETVELDDFFIARHPVTSREYLEFLNDLHRRDAREAAARVPRNAPESGPYWPCLPGGYAIPTPAWLAAAAPADAARAGRMTQTAAPWHEDWPVLSVSWEDGIACARALASRAGWLYTLPDALQWEFAARGADGRIYPWGNQVNSSLCNLNNSHPDGPRPVPVGDFPTDESPLGVRGLGGNSTDRCLNDAGDGYRRWRALRGGSWSRTGHTARTALHQGSPPTNIAYNTGFRLAAAVRLDS